MSRVPFLPLAFPDTTTPHEQAAAAAPPPRTRMSQKQGTEGQACAKAEAWRCSVASALSLNSPPSAMMVTSVT